MFIRIALMLLASLLPTSLIAQTSEAESTAPINIDFPRRASPSAASATNTTLLNPARSSAPMANADFICYVIDSVSMEVLSRTPLTITGAGRAVDEPNKADPPAKRVPAPDFTVLEVQSKRKVSLSQFKGQVVLIDFWASWCGPCQRPMAAIQEIVRKHPDWKNKAVILTISIDDELETARDHLEENRWNATLNTWAGSDGSAPQAYGVKSIPTMVLVDADGMIVKYGKIGDIESAMLALIE